jgi:hypothetical protein
MDVDFVAGGALLERGARPFPPFPSVSAMLRAAVRGEAVDALLERYRELREVEGKTRWVAGRGVETLPPEPALALVADLVEPGLSAEGLRERVRATRRRIRGAYDRVVAAGGIGALGQAVAAGGR